MLLEPLDKLADTTLDAGEVSQLEQDRGLSDPAHPQAETLLSFLNVQVKALATCEIGKHDALNVGPIDEIVVHYVIAGQGAVEWDGGRVALTQGMIAIIPRNFPKRLVGRGGALREVLLDDGCVLKNGIVRYQTSQDEMPLRLACATVSAGIGPGLGLFDHLVKPLSEPRDDKFSHMFEGILAEFAHPAIGGQSIIETYMKQILLLTFRKAMHRGDVSSPLYLTIVDYEIAKVVNAMVGQPALRHSMESLADIGGMTPNSLSERFERIFNQSPPQYLNLVRMTAAERLLRSTSLPVKAIAASVGFASRSHFSRTFAKRNGEDPTAFRKAQFAL